MSAEPEASAFGAGDVSSLSDIRIELAALQRRLEMLQACVKATESSNPALFGRPWVVEVASIVAHQYGLPLDEVMGSTRLPRSVRARQLWVWLVHTAGGFSMAETARMTGYVEHSMTYHCCRRVEAFRRDDTFFFDVSEQMLQIVRDIRQRAFVAARARQAEMAQPSSEGGA